ncbi:GxxExxY protein [Planctomycetes bacterium TBK1r]|uniref:GxxExxY protein n=1 Tax=Stieleria magnilauensis TaxID=2527963 RepID=A0ABX5Y2P1_9BACT|nr:hypothetical protein TBK1r_70540 [Planctomycetes bacterium TBK1r]
MPIFVDSEIKVLDEDAFHEFAHQVMGIIFSAHNECSRLIEEAPFKNVIQRRCEAAGISPVRREVQIVVTHKNFSKRYYMDLLLGCALMVEAKTVERLNETHLAQSLHYLMLAGMQHGLLVNLRNPRVEKRFVSTSLDADARRDYEIVDGRWKEVDAASRRLRRTFEDLLADWGAFLNLALYREALGHLLNGPQTTLRRVPIFDGDRQIGMHDVFLLSKDSILALTAVITGIDEMRQQLERFLNHTRMRCIQWINMHHHQIAFETIR